MGEGDAIPPAPFIKGVKITPLILRLGKPKARRALWKGDFAIYFHT